MKILDMRGQPCPIPVVNAKKALAEHDAAGVIVLVDNITAVQNLAKMANGTGCAFSQEKDGDSYKVKIVKGADSGQVIDEPLQPSSVKKDGQRGKVVFISSDSMGRGAEDLGQLLVKGFIFSLTQLNPLPEAVIFLNSGVRLTAEGANTVPDLKSLEEKGAGIFTCGTCAGYYKTSLAVGSIVNMMTITNLLAGASGIITI